MTQLRIKLYFSSRWPLTRLYFQLFFLIRPFHVNTLVGSAWIIIFMLEIPFTHALLLVGPRIRTNMLRILHYTPRPAHPHLQIQNTSPPSYPRHNYIYRTPLTHDTYITFDVSSRLYNLKTHTPSAFTTPIQPPPLYYSSFSSLLLTISQSLPALAVSLSIGPSTSRPYPHQHPHTHTLRHNLPPCFQRTPN